ncbi:uncharacterized protein LOC133347541 [Lethenteron reissneri]|uniref:uncharacterized protein LOC133347541 n=1 Tax=Lethenteron reissneri TaxID=7753 RepID=UPI002AB6982C|nr:uncharacterized protein LOC133347541 [Lethenteron reissneri]
MMGRERTNPFRRFFKYDPAKGASMCTIGGCQRVMSGNHGANLERHVRRFHPEEFHLATTNVKCEKEDGPPYDYGEPSSKKPCLTPGALQIPIDSMVFKKPKCIPVKITADQILDACTELVTLNGHPFSLVEDSGFRKLIDPVLKGLGGSLVINAENIRENVSVVAAALRSHINMELKNKLISLKVDSASYLDRSVLGINAQYVRDGEIVMHTLAMKEVKISHSGENLAAIIVDVLHEYNIDVGKIYSITTDNGANIIKSLTQGQMERNYGDDCDEQTEEAISETEDIMESLERSKLCLSEIAGPHSVMRGVHCAAHTLQLAIDDFLKEPSIANLVSNARRVCKRLNIKMPVFNCYTRWQSTFDMLECILELKDFCQYMAMSNPDLMLDDNVWDRIECLLAALKPAKMATKHFQTEQLTIGDVYGAWIKCHLETANVKSIYSDALAIAMKKCEKQLLDSDAILAAVYMDPRYSVLLTDREAEKAKQHLCQTWTAVELCNRLAGDLQADRSSDDDGTDRECDELERFLREKEESRRHSGNLAAAPALGMHIGTVLQVFANEPRLKKDANVLMYWESCKHSKPELFQLAQLSLSVPATQISYERVVSALSVIVSPHRCNLDNETLEDILMVQLNKKYGH